LSPSDFIHVLFSILAVMPSSRWLNVFLYGTM
jgi:hypothetical protein